QWMTGRDPLLDRDVGEQRARLLMLTSHQASGGCPSFAGVGGFFSELLNSHAIRRKLFRTSALRSRQPALRVGRQLQVG
ncbi:MAG: hypothetical protein ACK6BM_12510, partial [Cyanobacteriota bacterium]